MKTIITLFACFLITSTYAQNEWWKSSTSTEEKEEVTDSTLTETASVERREEPTNIEPGKITVIKNPSIDKLIKFKSTTIPPNKGPLMEGYRVQLFFDQSRTAVDKARTEILQLDSDIRTYIEYKAPNYLLLIGDYRTQLEAEKFRAEYGNNFPEAIVIKAKIYMPELKELETLEEE